MDENKYIESFEIISEAGDARCKALEAIEKAEQYLFDEAQALLAEANTCMNRAHKMQTDMIVREVNGQPVDTHILLVHAQDHFSMAMETIDMAKIIINLYSKISTLEQAK